jgi:hypothetical protein
MPASSATKILLEANLVLKYSCGEKTIEPKLVSLRLNKITEGPDRLVIATQTEPRGRIARQAERLDGTQIILFHPEPRLGDAKVAFIGPDENEVQPRSNSSGSKRSQLGAG